ncbi:MAG: bifunctional YncE family protein/alkaline phosphatase family protein [Pirellulales bacterium]|nr:bifunctional YncE family protein/alkaline phosphatase family protein [Pirellulales bacterium]
MAWGVLPIAAAEESTTTPGAPTAAPATPGAAAASADISLEEAHKLRTTPRVLPGLQADGKVQLPNQWSLRPAGRQILLGEFPSNFVLHPTQPYAAVMHSGYGDHEVVIVDLKTSKIVSRVNLGNAFWGITFNPAGDRLYASGGTSELVHAFKFADGLLSDQQKIVLGDSARDNLITCGLTCAADGNTLYACQTWGDNVVIIPTAKPDEKTVIALEKQSFPYATALSLDGKRLYVSLWGSAAVAVIDLVDNKVTATWPTKPAGEKTGGDHPTEMVLSTDGARLFVACANSNTVAVLSTADGQLQEVISSALYPNLPVGSTPTSISLSPNGQVLLIANADNNNVAMIDVSIPGKSNSLGHIPAGWYPTAVRFGKDEKIYITNGKGSQSLANPQGPMPEKRGNTPIRQYIGGLFRGTLSVIPPPSPDQMAVYSTTARACTPLTPDTRPAVQPRESDNPIPAAVGEKSPIKYCVYLIKENRTYDQVLGDLPQGNGDPQLCIFPEKVTPNQHAIVKQFVLLDNFYVESEVSADGHEWSTAAYATDFVERTWPINYRGGPGSDKIGYPAEGSYRKIAPSAGGYIWDRCKEAGVTYRSYGEFIKNGKNPGDPGTASVPGLEGHFDPLFRSYDLNVTDNSRVDRFAVELKEFEEKGEMPQFIIARLGNDHTLGTRLGKPTPTAMVAENDLAVGRFVELLSHSRFWPQMAIFIIEDDAQNGSDHVDAHRTTAYVISPYCKRRHVDSTMYSTASMLRSMGLILGLKPLSQFDAAATPMYHSFTAQPDLTPFKHLPAQVDLNELNMPGVYGAAESEKLDLSKEDAADDLVFNEIIWRSVRGNHSKMPPPVRASFVRVVKEEEE